MLLEECGKLGLVPTPSLPHSVRNQTSNVVTNRASSAARIDHRFAIFIRVYPCDPR
jgi:hypothetical protein